MRLLSALLNRRHRARFARTASAQATALPDRRFRARRQDRCRGRRAGAGRDHDHASPRRQDAYDINNMGMKGYMLTERGGKTATMVMEPQPG